MPSNNSTKSRNPNTTSVEARRTSTSSQGRPSLARQASSQKTVSRPGSIAERPGATPLQKEGRSNTNTAVYGSYRNKLSQEPRTPSFQKEARPSTARQLSNASSQSSQSYSQSRRPSVGQTLLPTTSAYETVYQDVMKIASNPRSEPAIDADKELNLCGLPPYLGYNPYAPYGELLAFGKLTLLSSRKPTSPAEDLDASFPAKTLLLTPDPQHWPFLSPLEIKVNQWGHPVKAGSQCRGFNGPVSACSDKLLRQGIFVFFECERVLDEKKLREMPQKVVLVKQPPRAVTILMTGYMKGPRRDGLDITSHPSPYRHVYKRGQADQDLTWGANVSWCEFERWPQLQAQQSQRDILVCFEGLTDQYATRCQAWKIRRIVAKANGEGKVQGVGQMAKARVERGYGGVLRKFWPF